MSLTLILWWCYGLAAGQKAPQSHNFFLMMLSSDLFLMVYFSLQLLSDDAWSGRGMQGTTSSRCDSYRLRERLHHGGDDGFQWFEGIGLWVRSKGQRWVSLRCICGSCAVLFWRMRYLCMLFSPSSTALFAKFMSLTYLYRLDCPYKFSGCCWLTVEYAECVSQLLSTDWLADEMSCEVWESMHSCNQGIYQSLYICAFVVHLGSHCASSRLLCIWAVSVNVSMWRVVCRQWRNYWDSKVESVLTLVTPCCCFVQVNTRWMAKTIWCKMVMVRDMILPCFSFILHKMASRPKLKDPIREYAFLEGRMG